MEALDPDLLPAVSLPVRSPRLVAGRSDGGAWVVAGDHREPGAGEILRVDAGGKVVWRAPIGPVLDLDVLGGDEAVLIEEGDEGVSVVLLELRGRRRELLRLDDARCLAATDRRVLVGRSNGVVLVRGSRDPAVLDWGLSRCAIGQVARGPRAGTWWALEGGERSTLHLLGPDLEPRWSTACHLRAPRMAPVPGREAVWVADGESPLVRRFGPGGILDREVSDLPLLGLGAGLAADGGGVLWCAPGAILRLDARGELVATRGGYRLLSDLDAVPSRASGGRDP